ncbi:MAG: hypothetical protein IKW83_11510 [Muribaculaceae bacterium]|nr:hypothetical protein [Muribaculaceae bacterium]
MKCIKCYREINDGNKFCNFCGTMQPLDREAYYREHPELATAMTNEELNIFARSNPLSPTPRYGAVSPPQPPTPPSASAGNEESQEVYVVTQPHIANNQKGDMMQCPECGNMVAANSSSCQYCGCPFVTPGAPEEYGHKPDPKHNNMNYDSLGNQNPKKSGMSWWAKTLLTLSILMLLGAIGAGVYYFLFYNKIEKLKADVELVKFSRKGGDKTITITTDADSFEVTKKPEWVTVTVGDKEITIKCLPLESFEDREGIIKLKAGDKEDKITVKQSSKATYLRLSQDMIRTGYKGEKIVIEIDTDGDPSTIEYDIENPMICSIYDKTGTGFTLNIEENTSYSVRQGTITIRSDKLEKTITIVQAKECSYCDGTGKDFCFSCSKTGRKDCPNCTDGKVYDGYNYELEESTYVTCDECGGRGDKACDKCNGRGYNTCEHCNGTGNTF